jgi:hypothetical protein
MIDHAALHKKYIIRTTEYHKKTNKKCNALVQILNVFWSSKFLCHPCNFIDYYHGMLSL